MTPFFVSMIVPPMTNIWPQLKDQVASFVQLLDSPIYQARLGPLGIIDLTTWQGAFYMYVGVTMEWAIVFLEILVPARIVTSEVDKKTLDVTLSYSIQRLMYLLEKVIVYLAYSLLYPAFVYFLAVVGTPSIRETLDLTVLGHAMAGFWLWLFALGALSLLCGTLFLESNRALSVSGALILTKYVMTRLGDLGNLGFLKDLSLFNYLSTGTILQQGRMLMNELSIVVSVGLIALLCALYTFQKRELAF